MGLSMVSERIREDMKATVKGLYIKCQQLSTLPYLQKFINLGSKSGSEFVFLIGALAWCLYIYVPA